MTRATSTIPDTNAKGPEKEKTIDELRHEALDGVLQIAQFGCLAFGGFADAGAIGVFGPPMADETVQLAANNSKVAEKVDLLINFGPYAGLVAAIIPFMAQLLVNHKMVKPEVFANAGVVDPEILEVQMKTQLMQKAAQVRQQQMEAQAELRRLEEEMLRNMNGDQQKESADIPND